MRQPGIHRSGRTTFLERISATIFVTLSKALSSLHVRLPVAQEGLLPLLFFSIVVFHPSQQKSK